MRLPGLKNRLQPPPPRINRLHRIHDLPRQRVRYAVLRTHAPPFLPAPRAVEVERVEACVGFVVRGRLGVEGTLLLLGEGVLGLEQGLFGGGGARGGGLVVVAEGADRGGGGVEGRGVEFGFRGVGIGGRVGYFFDAGVGHVGGDVVV